MSKYWVYIDDKMSGPYTVDQLIRLRGFSRHARVCAQEEGDAGPQAWISPADIPELSRIFKAVEETRPVMLPPRVKAKPPAPKPRLRPSASDAPPEPAAKRGFPWSAVVGVLVVGVLAAGSYLLWQQNARRSLEKERLQAKQLVENYAVGSPGNRVAFSEYLAQKNIEPRWEYERQPTGLYNVSVIWFESGAHNIPSSAINAFEVNLEAQTVRPLNSRAAKLGAENSAPPRGPEPPAKPKLPDFQDALSTWQTAMQDGDFETVWNMYSERKIRDMGKGGISHAGFVRLQALTHNLESGMAIDVAKIKKESDEGRLVLLRQTQKGRPDILMRQYWTLENGVWKLDDEQKKAAPSGAADAPADAAPASDAAAAPAPPPVTSLPGVSH